MEQQTVSGTNRIVFPSSKKRTRAWCPCLLLSVDPDPDARGKNTHCERKGKSRGHKRESEKKSGRRGSEKWNLSRGRRRPLHCKLAHPLGWCRRGFTVTPDQWCFVPSQYTRRTTRKEEEDDEHSTKKLKQPCEWNKKKKREKKKKRNKGESQRNPSLPAWSRSSPRLQSRDSSSNSIKSSIQSSCPGRGSCVFFALVGLQAEPSPVVHPMFVRAISHLAFEIRRQAVVEERHERLTT